MTNYIQATNYTFCWHCNTANNQEINCDAFVKFDVHAVFSNTLQHTVIAYDGYNQLHNIISLTENICHSLAEFDTLY
jgi:hypothetical protein